MVDYPTIKPALLGLVSSLSGVDLANVVYEDEGQLYGQTQILLKLHSPNTIGRDWTQFEDSDDGLLKATVVGCRQITLSISAECISHEPASFAPQILEKIRSRLFRESTRYTLSTLKLSVAEVFSVLEVPFDDGDHRWSKYVLDVRFNTVAEDVDTEYDGSWIDSVELNTPFSSGVLTVTNGWFTSGFDSGFRKST